jgi:spermidine/putrescine transport system permease protein
MRLRPGTLLMLPALVYLTTFFVGPVALIAYYSLGRKPSVFSPVATDRLGLEQYQQVLDPTFLSSFVSTLQIAVLGTLGCLVVGFPLAYWAALHLSPRARALVLVLLLVPFWTNFLVRTLGWAVLLSGEGVVSQALQDLGHPPLAFLDTRGAVQLGVVYNYLVYLVLPVFVALERTDPAQREAARDLGAGRWRTFRDITLPSAAGGVAAGCLLVFIPLCGDYITASVLGGAKGTMVGQLVAGQFLGAQNWALGSAMAVSLVLAVLLVVGLATAASLVVRAVARRRRYVRVAGP